MWKLFLVGSLVFLVPFAASTQPVELEEIEYIAHCQGESNNTAVLCGHNLSRALQRIEEDLESGNFSKNGSELREEKKTISRLLNVNNSVYSFSNSKYPKPSYEASITVHFYRKKEYEKEDLKFEDGCWKTNVEENSLFYKLYWGFDSNKWYCLQNNAQGRKAISNANFYKSPLDYTWLGLVNLVT